MPSQSPVDSIASSPGDGSMNVSSEKSIHSPQEKQEILRNCVVRVKELENNININTADHLEPIIDEADRINKEGTMEEKIKNIEEVVLDSEVMCIASHVIKKCSATLTRDISSYDPIEFAEKIQQYTKRMPDTIDDDIDWSLLGKEIMHYFKRTAKFTMLLGTLRPIPKKEVVRRKAVREAQAPTKRPEKVITVDKVEDSVEETVNGIKRLIRRYQKHHKEPVDFFSLVLHPTSYGKTIENILHTSFLIRDGFIQFIIDEDGIPYVQDSPGEKDDESNEPKPGKNTRNIQNVLSLNMQQWKTLVEAYGITKPMIDLDSKKSKHSK